MKIKCYYCDEEVEEKNTEPLIYTQIHDEIVIIERVCYTCLNEIYGDEDG